MNTLVVFSILCVAYVASYETKKNSTLILTHVIFRHGDRTPVQEEVAFFMTNVSLNFYKDDFYPYGMGELNLRGKRRSYQFGLSLRQRYKTFLGNIYDNNIVDAISSEYSRTQMTLQLVLAALFPPMGKWKISTGLKWQPTFYKILTFKKDYMLAIHFSCGKILLSNLDKSNEADLYDNLKKHTGINATDFILAALVENSMNVQIENGIGIFEWVRPFWPEPLKSAAKREYKSILDQHVSTISGVLCKKILTDSEMMINGTLPSGRKIILYSGHDINVLGFLTVIGHFKNHYIQYTGHLLIELHKIDEVYGFKVFYQNYQTYKPKLLDIKNCGKFCPIDKFAEIVNRVYKGDHYCP